MLYDFKFPRPKLTEYCFRFVPAETAGPDGDGLFTQGEVRVWLFVAEQWSGPYPVGLTGILQRDFPVCASGQTSPEWVAMHQAIYDRKHWLMDIQRSIDAPPDGVTGRQLMAEYYRRYPHHKLTPSYEYSRT